MEVGILCQLLVSLCLSQHATTQEMPDSPQIVPSDDDITVLPGDVFSRRCQASSPVRWLFFSQDQAWRSRVRISDTQESDGLYVSDIEVGNVSYLDVGYQYCVFTADLSQNLQQIPAVGAKLYLFVKDRSKLLVQTDPVDVYTITPGRRSVIACKPTHPDVNVTLVTLQTGQDPDQFRQSMVFDPRRGFIIEDPQSRMHQGGLTCQAEYVNVSESHLVLVNFNKPTDSVDPPLIELIGSRNVVEGGNFSLKCKLPRVDNVHVFLEWRLPGSSTGYKTGRILQLRQTQEMGRLFPSSSSETLIDVRQLVVSDARLEDAGSFICLVRDHNENNSNSSQYIDVHDRSSASVELIPHVQQFDTDVMDDIEIVVEIDAFPPPIITWFTPSGLRIPDGTSSQKYSVETTVDDTVLRVFGLTLDDMGSYVLKARSPNGNAFDSKQFNVTVNDIARVRLQTDRMYFQVNETYVLKCAITGFPLPRVLWGFKYCDAPDICADKLKAVVEPGDNEEAEMQVNVSEYMLESHLSVTARRSGIYVCMAQNPSIARADLRFIVTDISDGFGAVASSELVVDGDAFALNCAGSRFSYSGPDKLQWYVLDETAAVRVPVLHGPVWTVSESETPFSYSKTLAVQSVTRAESGRYVCAAVPEAGVENVTEIFVDVRDSEIPRFISSANMDLSESILLEEGTPAQLNCTVSGLPVPQVTWSKDGVVLDDGGLADGRVRLLDGGQQLLISASISDDSGTYECIAANRIGSVVGSITLHVPGDGPAVGVILAVVLVMLLVFLPLAAYLLYKIRQQKKLQHRLTMREMETFTNGMMNQYNPCLSVEEQAELLPYDDEWEFPKERLILGRQIGSGAFGRVLKAEAVGLTEHEARTVVAVKMPRSGSDPDQIRSLMAELKIMIQLGRHLNVVNLLGAVTQHAINGEFMVMVEYCRYGNLHQYLLKHKHYYISQLEPMTGEYNPVLGEDDFDALLAEDIGESTPLSNTASAYMVPSSRSYYKTPRPHSTADSLTSCDLTSADMTGGTTVTMVCSSPDPVDDSAALTGGGVSRSRIGGHSMPRAGHMTPLTTRDLLRWSYQVASGMQYLASRKLLHGDLAARNILLAEEKIVKISDFGLSRDIYKTRDYKKTAKGLLPVKWMAVESIQDSVFSTQSDVWAFGIVLWEFFSLGSTPYPGMEYDLNFVRRLRDGYRMEMPKFAPKSVYVLMLECWRDLPGDRPSFPELCHRLGQFLEDRIVEEYNVLRKPFDSLNEGYFSRRTNYVNQIMETGDYQNVNGHDAASTDDVGSVGGDGVAYINVDAAGQTVAYSQHTAESAGQRPTAVVLPTTRTAVSAVGNHSFDQLPEQPAATAVANNFYNPGYRKLPTQPSPPSAARRALPPQDEQNYLVPRV